MADLVLLNRTSLLERAGEDFDHAVCCHDPDGRTFCGIEAATLSWARSPTGKRPLCATCADAEAVQLPDGGPACPFGRRCPGT